MPVGQPFDIPKAEIEPSQKTSFSTDIFSKECPSAVVVLGLADRTGGKERVEQILLATE